MDVSLFRYWSQVQDCFIPIPEMGYLATTTHRSHSGGPMGLTAPRGRSPLALYKYQAASSSLDDPVRVRVLLLYPDSATGRKPRRLFPVNPL